jgi:DNA-binding NtrC family response regulator
MGQRHRISMAAAKTILVVVAAQEASDIIQAQLQAAGFQVMLAATTDEADAVLQGGSDVDLLLADISVSGAISAVDLVQRASTRDPRLKILFTTDLASFSRSDPDSGDAESPMLTVVQTLLAGTAS